MKKRLFTKVLTVFCVIAMSVFGAVGCDSLMGGTKDSASSSGNSSVITPTISLNASTKEVTVGESFTLTATTTPADAEIVWSSSNEAIATVNNGTVVAVSAGTATITAKNDTATAICTITVKAAQVQKFTVVFKNGETVLKSVEVEKDATVTYDGAEPVKEATEEYTYTFKGWSATENGEVLDTFPSVTENATYYAVFEENAVVVVPEFTSGKIQYSENSQEVFLPEGLLGAGVSIEKAVVKTEGQADATAYENGAWVYSAIALTEEELKANEIGMRKLEVSLSDGAKYLVNMQVYAGIIDELSDFPAFFNNTAVPSETDPETYPAVAPNVYGYYIVTKDLGSLTDELTLTQVEETDYQKTNGFNGVLDGQGHTLQFKLMKGGLVGLVLGNAVIKNLAVIYEDASFVGQGNNGGGYGAFGYVTNGSPEIRNCYIERTNNVASRSSVLGIMARPNNKLILHNTVVYGFYVPNDCTWWSNTWISEASTNAYAIAIRDGKETQQQLTNFTKVYAGGTGDVHTDIKGVNLSDIEDASGFDDRYWYKENDKLIWKGFDIVNVSWVNGDTTSVVTFMKDNYIVFPELNGMYWSEAEGGTAAATVKVLAEEDCTYYAVEMPKAIEGDALYSTVSDEFFLPAAMGASMSEIVSITSVDGATIYYENSTWVNNFDLTDEQIKANDIGVFNVIVQKDTEKYTATVKSYAGVIDELSDFPKFFNNEAVASEFTDATAVAPNVYGYYIVTKSLGTGSEELALTQTEATDYYAANGFNGVLDGQGHKLQFTLTSGGLVGMILGNATIKNLAVAFTDNTSGHYGVFGYRAGGHTIIENCYIERVNNPYTKTTIYGIIACTNKNLELRNTAVHGGNMSNTADLYSNMYISESSTNAFLIYARSAASGWGISANFTEIAVSSNTLTSDLSSFDANYWTTTDNNLGWKGAADLTFASVIKITA